MVSRRTILQIGVVLCLLVQAFLLSGPAQADNHTQATQTANIDSILDPRLVVQPLPQRPIESDSYNVVSIDTRQGKLYLYFDHKQRKLQIYADRAPMVTIDYPAELIEDRYSYNDVYYSERKNVAVYCPPYVKGIFVIGLAKKQFRRVDTIDCPRDIYSLGPDVRWSPDGRYFAYKTPQREQRFYDAETQKILTTNEIASRTVSWLHDWSPRWEYQVVPNDILTSTDLEKCPEAPEGAVTHDQYRFALVVTSQRTKVDDILFCTDWERIGFRWLNEDRVWLEGYQPADGGLKAYEVFVATRSTGKAVSFGLNVKWEGDFFANDTKFARIRSSDGFDLTRCTLNIIDLKTLTTTDIETTGCLQPGDIHVIEPLGKLFYVHDDAPTTFLADLVSPSPRMVDLKTLKITGITARKARQILLSSPDKRYLVLLASDQVPPRNIYSQDPWPQSQLLVYDIRQDKVIYERELAKNFHFADIDWSPTYSAFVFSNNGRDNYFNLVTLNKHPQTTPLTESFSRSRYLDNGTYLSGTSHWSPDGQYFLFYRPEGIHVVRAKDQKIMTVTKALETATFVIDARWYGGNSHMLLIEAIPRQRSEPYFTAGRWVVDPARATE
jgi:hypothetical protein